MKKIIVCVFVFLFFNSIAFALNCNHVCSNNMPSKSFAGSVASVTGINALVRSIAQAKIAGELKKQTNSKFKVKISSWWGVSLFGGEFSNLSAVCNKYYSEGIYLSDVRIETLCPYNKISISDNDVKFDYDLPLKFSFVVTQENLDNILAESGYKKIIDGISSTPLLKIQNAEAKIKENRLQFCYKIAFLGIKRPVSLSYSARLKIENNKLELCDVKFLSGKYASIMDKLTNWSVDFNKNSKAHISLQNVKILNSKIMVDGFVVIPKG